MVSNVSNKGISRAFLESVFLMAIDMDVKYVGVMVESEDSPDYEIIINPIENAVSKIDYYSKAYDDYCVLKSNPKIRIVNASYGETFSQIEYELLGDM